MREALEIVMQRSCAGDSQATRTLIHALRPVVHARVAQALRTNPRARGRDPRQEVADLTQEVFLALFKDQSAVLRRWDVDGGLSLKNFVGLVAYRRATNILLSRGTRWRADAVDPERLREQAGAVSLENQLISRSLLKALRAAFRAELKPSAFELFELLLIQQQPISELCEQLNMSSNALYTARSRFLKRARKVLEALEEPDV